MIILPPTVPQRSHPVLAKYVVDSIELSGVRVPSTSRLRRMLELYNSGDRFIPPTDPGFQAALEAVRDMQLLGFVFDQFDTTCRSEHFVKLLRRLIKDSVLPQHDRIQSKGRDAAFELYVAAICKSARLEPVVFQEPDVTCEFKGVVYGLAAKRIKSVKSIEQRVRKAVDQITQSGHRGIVLIDTCLAFNPNNDRVDQPLPSSLFMARYWHTLRSIWSGFQPKMQQIMSESSNVLGIVVHDCQVRFLEARNWELAGMTMRVPALSRTSSEQREFETFAAVYTYGLPNQEDVSNPSLRIP